MTVLSEAIFAWWLFGIFTVALTVFFSTLSKSSAGVLLGTVAGITLSYVLSLIPRLAPYTPTALTSVTDGNIVKAVTVTVIVSAVLLASSIPLMNKKAL